MSDTRDDRIREWVQLLFAILKEEYGHDLDRLRMKIRLKNGDRLRVRRTPLQDSGSGDVEVEFIRKSERSP